MVTFIQEIDPMPYKSEAQRRAFHALAARHEISADTVKEFDQASKGKKLPEKLHPDKTIKVPSKAPKKP